MAWNDELLDLISKKWKIGQSFSLEDIYQFEDHFSKLHPTNNFVQAKLRQTLQNLKTKGFIEFMDNRGHYIRIK